MSIAASREPAASFVYGDNNIFCIEAFYCFKIAYFQLVTIIMIAEDRIIWNEFKY